MGERVLQQRVRRQPLQRRIQHVGSRQPEQLLRVSRPCEIDAPALPLKQLQEISTIITAVFPLPSHHLVVY